MVKVLNPQYEEIAVVPKAELQAFLDKNGLVGIRRSSGKDSVVAFDAAIADQLSDSRANKPRVQRRLLNAEQLRLFFSDAIERNENALYEVRMPDVRHYFTLTEFTKLMNQCADSVANARIIIPAGDYGTNRWIFGMGPLDHNPEENPVATHVTTPK